MQRAWNVTNQEVTRRGPHVRYKIYRCKQNLPKWSDPWNKLPKTTFLATEINVSANEETKECWFNRHYLFSLCATEMCALTLETATLQRSLQHFSVISGYHCSMGSLLLYFAGHWNSISFWLWFILVYITNS